MNNETLVNILIQERIIELVKIWGLEGCREKIDSILLYMPELKKTFIENYNYLYWTRIK